ncbi:hypothetical protein A2U01_0053553, partial [Trifolium medium]|nr:hypothetical protein [Trifolium medium]
MSKGKEQLSNDGCGYESDDEEMNMFVKRFDKYVKKNGVKFNDVNAVKFRKQSSKNENEENNVKGKS